MDMRMGGMARVACVGLGTSGEEDDDISRQPGRVEISVALGALEALGRWRTQRRPNKRSSYKHARGGES
eukprot:4317282-Prymnesium_polylepis.1